MARGRNTRPLGARRRLLGVALGATLLLTAGAAVAAAPLFDLSGDWTGYANGAPNTDSLQLTMDAAGDISGTGTVSGEAFTLGGAETASGAVSLKLIQGSYVSTDSGTVVQGGNCFSGTWSDSVGGAGHSGNFVWVRNGAAVTGAGTTASPYACASSSSSAPLPVPVIAKTVNLMPVSGKVFIKLPAPAYAATFSGGGWLLPRLESLAKGQGFVSLTQPRQLPVGTEVDARRGSLALVSAATVRGTTQTGTFTGGVFKILQQRAQKGLTTLSLQEGAFHGGPSYKMCSTLGKQPRAGAAAKPKQVSAAIVQTLTGTAKGAFATRGRFASATVQGTQWRFGDRCDGTFTKVFRGVVLVRDFATRKTIRVTTGHSFLAKATKSKY